MGSLGQHESRGQEIEKAENERRITGIRKETHEKTTYDAINRGTRKS